MIAAALVVALCATIAGYAVVVRRAIRCWRDSPVTRHLDAVRALELWRLRSRATPYARRARAVAAVELAARTHRELTVEDVSFSPAVPDELRTWAMTEAARRGVLRPLGSVSGTQGRHGPPVRLWASLIVTPERTRP